MSMQNAVTKRRERGKVNKGDIEYFSAYDVTELLSLLHSEVPVERTCSAIHLRKFKNHTVVNELCRQLTHEKHLYTKIALCETLAKYGDLSIDPLIELLGQIGNNHETKIPEKGFYKTSYPLPRDIAARTICRLGSIAISPLENFIKTSNNIKAIAQAIDAYGHIIYSKKLARSSSIFQVLHEKYNNNDFLKYKIIRSLSCIHDKWAEIFLLDAIQTGSNGLRLEALRSLILLKVNLPDNIRKNFTAEMQKLESFLKKR